MISEMSIDLHQETIASERRFKAPSARVSRAFTDPKQREIWSVPDDQTKIDIVEWDIRTGGHEKGLCGTPGAMNWTMLVTYHLVLPDRLISLTEELWDGDRLLTVALITFDISPVGDREAKLILTDQVTSFVDDGATGGHRWGYAKALENLEKFMA